MATRGKTRQGRSSLGLERLELEGGQGQGGEQELEIRRGTRLTGWTFFILFFGLLCIEIFHFGMETTWQASLLPIFSHIRA